MKRPRILILCPYPEGVAAGQRLKYEQYINDWRERGYEVTISSFINDHTWNILYDRGHLVKKCVGTIAGYLRRVCDLFRLRTYDLVYVHMWGTPFGTAFYERILRLLATKIVFDVEDNLLLGQTRADANHPNWFLRFLKSSAKPRYLVRHADHVISASPQMDEIYREENRKGAATYIPPSIDTNRFVPRQRESKSDVLTIGWTGTFSSRIYLDLLRPVLQELARRRKFRLLVIGNFEYDLSEVCLEVVKWNREQEIEQLQAIDIGVYPLPADDWAVGKAGLKVIQYMAMGLPSVSSDVGVNSMIVTDGENGLLVKTESEWLASIERLLDNAELRRSMGRKARVNAVANYSTEIIAGRYRAVLEKTISSKP